MNRFFISHPNITNNIITMEDREQVHHINSVLHLKVKEPVLIFDKEGNEYNCVISELGERVALEVNSKRIKNKSGNGIILTIACAIPKKSRFDDIVEKLTQLGVTRIIPLLTERVVVKLDREKEGLRLGRWRKIAQSAAEQSQRNDIPEITEIKDFKELVSLSSSFDLKLIPTLFGIRKGIKDVFSPLGKESKDNFTILVLIGPEGDFTDDEINIAKCAGFIPITLGDLVLRVETAAIAVASFARFYAHD